MDRKFGILALFSMLTFIITSCGGSGTTTPDPDFSIAVSNAAPSFAEGATTDITVTVTPQNGFADQVALTINNPADVTASFNPASTNSTSVLTLGSGTAGTFPMTVTATSGAITKTAGVTLTVTGSTGPPAPTTTTIAGKVVDTGGRPVNGAAVVILGQNPSSEVLETTALTGITNANGNFSISGVEKPYDIATISSTFGTKIGVAYLGLTKDDPTLVVADFSISPNKEARIKGAATVRTTPTAQHVIRGAFGSPETLSTFSLDNSGNYEPVAPGAYVGWFGPNTTTGKVHVLEWKRISATNSNPMSFTGYGVTNTTLVDQGTANNQDITLTTLGSGNAGGNITMPTGYTIDDKSMYVSLDANTSIQFVNDSSAAEVFNYVTPAGINNAKLSVEVETTSADGRTSEVLRQGLSLTDTNIAIDIKEAPSLALPPNNATSISYNTDFEWAPFGFTNSVNLVSITSGPTNQAFFVITKDSKITLPDLTGQGMPIDPSFGAPGTPIPYEYEVQSIGPLTSIDAAAGPDFVKLIQGQLLNSDMAMGFSQTFDFTVPSQ